MSARTIAAIACLLIGVGLAAWSLAYGYPLFAVMGFALIFTFLFLALEAMNKAGKPKHEIKRAADAAWNLKDKPLQPNGHNKGER